MAVTGGTAITGRCCTHAARQGFVIIPTPLAAPAHRQVVHGALAGRGKLARQRLREGAADRIDDPAAGLHVAGGDRGRRQGVDQATLRRLDRNALQGAMTGRCMCRHQAAENVENGRRGHRHGAIQVAFDLRCGAGKVHLDAVIMHTDRDPDRDIRVTMTVIVQVVLKPVLPMRDTGQALLYQRLRPALQTVLLLLEAGRTDKPDQFLQTSRAEQIGCDLGVEIPPRRVGPGQLPQYGLEENLIHFGIPHQQRRRDQDTLFGQHAADGHGARGIRADVRVVCPVGAKTG